jgi:hypothetical protein
MTNKFNFSFLFFLLLGISVFAQSPNALNVQFQNGLIYTQVPTQEGVLNLMANTSGGAYIVASAIQNKGIPSITDETGHQFVKMDELLGQAGLPKIRREKTLVIKDEEANLQAGVDGELGQAWFANYCWQFDYENQSLIYNQRSLSEGSANTVPVLFKENEQGNRMSNLPQVFATVDGVEMPFLIDTGAKLYPTASASAALESSYSDEPVAASFIIEFIFEHWRSIHPEWTVVEHADAKLGNVKMIQVPEMTIAGTTVGPVWFCTRPDVNYLEYMARFSNVPAMGSLGGNFLKNFNLTIDYPNKLAKFGMPNRS